MIPVIFTMLKWMECGPRELFAQETYYMSRGHTGETLQINLSHHATTGSWQMHAGLNEVSIIAQQFLS